MPASVSLTFTLNRAALRSFSEVIHTVPSSSCTCCWVTELMISAPATMPNRSSSMMIGVIHCRLPDGISLRSIAPILRDLSYDCEVAVRLGCADLSMSLLRFSRSECGVTVVRYGLAAQAIVGFCDIRRSARIRLT